MKHVKRYDTECGYGCSHGAYEYEDGPWVAFEDYAALSAENERLRKAGDAMFGVLAGAYFGWVSGDAKAFDELPHIAAWNAAKEGRDAIGCLVDPAKVAQYLPKHNAAKEGSDAK